MVIGVLFFWLALSIIVGVAANTRGRNPVGWFFLSILFSPLLAGLLVLALPNQGGRFAPIDAEIRRNIVVDRVDDGGRWAGPMVLLIISAMFISAYIFGKAR